MNLIYSLVGTTKQYYRYNGHGDVVALANSSGTVTKTYTYNAFGEEQNIDNLDANPFRYCGEYYDKVSGTLYLRARNYNASIGRFTQEDPIRDGGNWYSYCSANPINLVDPLGLFNWDIFLKGVTAVVIGAVAITTVIATGGAATPLVAAGLSVTAAAGTTSVIFGAHDICESITGENKLKETLGEPVYEIVETVSEIVSSAGTYWISSNPQAFNSYYETEPGPSGNSLCEDDFDVPDDVNNFIKNNDLSVEDTLNSFEGTPEVIVLEEDTTVYRYWGGDSPELGHWVSPNDYGSDARDLLSLPTSNTATNMSSFVISKGTSVLSGTASQIFKNPTGGGNSVVGFTFRKMKNTNYNLIKKYVNDVLLQAEKEIDNSETSKWDNKTISNVVCREMQEILSSLLDEEDFAGFIESRKMLISKYYMTDSLVPLEKTELGRRISSLNSILFH